MDDASFSWLLQELTQQKQIDGMDFPSFENLENNLYITNNDNTTLDLFSVLLDEPANDSGSSGSGTEELLSSNPSPTNDNVNTQNKKRKRREMQKEWEAKRRNKFQEQLSMLRNLLCADQDHQDAKVTREAVMSSAIQEILKLRQQLSNVNSTTETDTKSLLLSLGIGKVPVADDYQSTLSDPMNRNPYSTQDLERAFQTMFAREFGQMFGGVSRKVRSDQAWYHSIKSLDDISKQIGKPEYQLNVGILEQIYHSMLKFNPTELRKTLETNWNVYQALKKGDKNHLLLFAESEIGAWILTDMSSMQYMTGNIEACERTYNFAKQLSKKMKHHTTNRFLLANLVPNVRGCLTLSTAEKISKIIQRDYLWGPVGHFILGSSLIAHGKHKEGIEAMELCIRLVMDRMGESIVLCMMPAVVEAYLQTGNVDKGLRWANYTLKKYSEFNIDGSCGKAELMRLKANLVMMKKYPNYIPERIQLRYLDCSIDDLVDLCESTSISTEQPPQKPVFGPSTSTVLHECLSTPIDVGNEDVEMLLRSSLNLAQVRGIHTIALRCATDLTRYFVTIGDMTQAMETAQIVKSCTGVVKGPDDIRELQRARYVLSLVECSQ